MSPIEGPESNLVYSTERPQLGRTEFKARERFTVHGLAVAAFCAHQGYEVLTHFDSQQGGRVLWSAPVAARRDADRFKATFDALTRGMRAMMQQQQTGANASQVTGHERK